MWCYPIFFHFFFFSFFLFPSLFLNGQSEPFFFFSKFYPLSLCQVVGFVPFSHDTSLPSSTFLNNIKYTEDWPKMVAKQVFYKLKRSDRSLAERDEIGRTENSCPRGCGQSLCPWATCYSARSCVCDLFLAFRMTLGFLVSIFSFTIMSLDFLVFYFQSLSLG